MLMSASPQLTVLSTRNEHKVKEFNQILAPLGLHVVPITELVPNAPPIDEIGHTFLDNAILKAAGAWSLTGKPALADDSGLCVDALGGAPGLFSARWAGGDDEDNNDKLLAELEPFADEQRTAHYMCAIAYVTSIHSITDLCAEGVHTSHPFLPEGAVLIEAEGRVHGRIIRERSGTGGFGYDPLFFVPQFNATFAEVPASEKHAISHRGVALRQLRARLLSLTGSSSEG
jgi:XTP/dITP diphosphohydrolase